MVIYFNRQADILQQTDRQSKYDFTHRVFDLVLLLLAVLVAVDLDTQVVSTLLPVHLAIGDSEQVLHAQLLAGRDVNECDAGRRVALLGHPVRDDVVCR